MNRYPGRRLVRMTLALTIVAIVPVKASAQRAEGSFQRTLTVEDGPDVEISAGSGRIEIRAGSTNRVEISARIRADGRGSGWFGRNALSPEERVRRVEAKPQRCPVSVCIRLWSSRATGYASATSRATIGVTACRSASQSYCRPVRTSSPGLAPDRNGLRRSRDRWNRTPDRDR